MTLDTRTPAEKAYDDLKSGAIYAKPADDEIAIAREADRILADRCCPNGTPTRDCAACTAKYAAEREHIQASAAAAPTMRDRVDILLSNHEVPSGDHVFDLLLEDDSAHYVWARCIDWVLWRQAHGKPVKRCGDADACPAAIDARYDAARVLASNLESYRTATDVGLLCAGELIERWERTPAQQAQIDTDNDLMIAMLDAIETAPLGAGQ